MSSGIGGGSTTTDREQIDHLQSDREQRRLAEKGNSKYIFTIPRDILPKLSLCDEITVMKSLVRAQFVAVSWLGSIGGGYSMVVNYQSLRLKYHSISPPLTQTIFYIY